MTEPLKRTLGSRVRAARKRAGLTQDELASRIDKTPESISNIKRGAQTPALETLSALARELAVRSLPRRRSARADYSVASRDGEGWEPRCGRGGSSVSAELGRQNVKAWPCFPQAGRVDI